MQESANSILIVEDDRDLVKLIKINLQDAGYNVHTAGDGLEALKLYEELDPSLLILDIMLPKLDGFEVCRRIRQENRRVPILMLTAKAEEVDKILGLELGADDYMTKPFSIRELTARVKAIFRRIKVDQENEGNLPRELVFNDLKIYPKKRKVTLSDSTVELTSKEYDLLLLFSSNPGKAYSREQLLNQVWGYSYEGYSHTVNSHINRLRSKIEDDPSNPQFIKTVWGVGYRFADLEEAENHA
ncbi:response regulator transcription factor [Rhodohalobacter sp. 614A]|uniref:response regulator transcription factor n=1 Tax=Rhodohalobacter sp. 614A TaxID=2908649 RepID=UPI001F46CD89|nr:response regulator transcription factor [Rhodohalobacter sp. 614A]